MKKPRAKKPKAFRNSFEARCSHLLGKEFAYEPFKIPYVIEHTYLPDFVDEKNKIIVSAKGLFYTNAQRLKYVELKKQYPDYVWIFIFQDPTIKISKNSRTTYKMWAIKNGFEVIDLE